MSCRSTGVSGSGGVWLRPQRTERRCLGYARMLLDTLPEMAEAIRLYRTLGFVETDRYWDNPITRTIYLEKKLGTVSTEPDRAE